MEKEKRIKVVSTMTLKNGEPHIFTTTSRAGTLTVEEAEMFRDDLVNEMDRIITCMKERRKTDG